MSDGDAGPLPESRGTNHFQLVSLVLGDCSVQRGAGDPTRPGAVSANQDVEPAYSDGVLTYRVASALQFMDEDDDLVVEIASTFVAVYEVGETAPTDADINAFSRSVLMHVTPFHREFIATMTNRLAIPAFYMPLLRRSEIKLAEDEEDVPGES